MGTKDKEKYEKLAYAIRDGIVILDNSTASLQISLWYGWDDTGKAVGWDIKKMKTRWPGEVDMVILGHIWDKCRVLIDIQDGKPVYMSLNDWVNEC